MQPIDLAHRLLKNIDPMGNVFASRRAQTEFDSERALPPEVWERWSGERPDDLSEWTSDDLDLAQTRAPTAEWHERLSNERVRRGINIIPHRNMIDVGRDNDKNPLPSNRDESDWMDSVHGDFNEGLEDWQQKNASEPMDLAHRLLKTDGDEFDERDWQPALPEDNPDPQSYNDVQAEDDIIDPSHLTEAEFYEILAHGDQEHIDEAIRRRAEERWQQKNASEPFEIAYRLLKMPIVPGSLKHTETDDLYNIEGKFYDPKSEETMPIFLDWYKPQGEDAVAPEWEKGDIDIGINHPEDFEIEDWDNANLAEDEARRGALQFAQMPSGDYVPGPSMNATAVQVADNFRQRGYSTAMVEMLGELLSRTGDVHINPFVDGFTWQGFQMIQGIMQKQPQLAEQLRQHFMKNMDKIPDALRNINMLNMLTTGEDIDKRGMFDRAAMRGRGSWDREAAQDVARKRQDRGGYNA